MDFKKYQLDLVFDNFIGDFSKSSFYSLSKGADILPTLSYKDSTLFISNITLINSYFAAFISDYIRVKMLDTAKIFTIETVMSHNSKLDYLKLAKEKGFRIYLYFVSTRDVKVNIGRVEQRVALGGHYVSNEKIEKRYYNSLGNLKDAILLSDRAYIFDNSGEAPIWYAEYDNGNLNIKYDEIPSWINEYLINKIIE